MYYRLVAICLSVALHLVGAIHYRPLWIGVIAMPICLHLAFKHEAALIRREERCLRDAAYERLKEFVLNLPLGDEE